MAQIDIPDLPSNSYVSRKSAAEEAQVVREASEKAKQLPDPIAKNAVRKAPSRARRAWIRFVGEDLPDVKDHFIDDVLFPTIRNMIFDGFVDGLSMLLFHEVGRVSAGGKKKRRYDDYTSYSYSGRRGRSRRDDDYYEEEDRKKPRLDEILIQDEYENGRKIPAKIVAERVLCDLRDYIEDYDKVSVAYYYGLCGCTPDYTDESWGWDNLDFKITISQCGRDACRINMPKPKPID